MEEMRDYAASPEPPPQYSAEPRGRKGGYSRLPTYDYPPEPNRGFSTSGGYQPYPPMQPMPAPVMQQQQSSNTNVVVVGQPQGQPQAVTVRPRRQATSFVALSAILLVLCMLHCNLPALICLIPAIICSCVASDHNDADQYEEAKTCGNMSLFCNLCSIIYFVIVLVAIVAIVVIIFVVGIKFFQNWGSVVTVTDNYNSFCVNGQMCQQVGSIKQCMSC